MTQSTPGRTVQVLGPVPPSLAAQLAAAGLISVASTEAFAVWAPGAPPPEEDQP